MKKAFLIVFLLCFLLIGTSAAILFYTQYIVFDIKEIPMDVLVSDHIGFNLNSDMLHFGRTTTPGSAERAITIKNQYDQPIRVTIQTYGEIGPWVYTQEYDPLFEPGAIRNITLGVNVPSGIEYGNHTGTARVLFTRVLI